MVSKVILVAPRGFCAGVVRAVETVEAALEQFGPPIYVRRAIVHNPHVVNRLADLGAVFVQELDEVPVGGRVVFSAHGVAKSVPADARARGLFAIDATCALVGKVHSEVTRFLADGCQVVLVGHAGHDEVIGSLGQAPGQVHLVTKVADVPDLPIPRGSRVAVVTQTTLSPDDVQPVMQALTERYPDLTQPRTEDICFATRNRQMAVRWLAKQSDVVLVLGDHTSSNSIRLREVAASLDTHAYLLGSIAELDERWLEGVEVVGITAGASTPESIVQEAVDFFRARGAEVLEETLQREPIVFSLPPEVVSAGRGRANPDRTSA
jgi:4-hydroxy-3-methylbut-2-en-1-yl diphosphate reductase